MKLESVYFHPRSIEPQGAYSNLTVIYRDDNYNYCDIVFENEYLQFWGAGIFESNWFEANDVCQPFIKGLFGDPSVPKVRINSAKFVPLSANTDAVYANFEVDFTNDTTVSAIFRASNQKFGIGKFGVNKTPIEQADYVHDNLQRLLDHQVVYDNKSI